MRDKPCGDLRVYLEVEIRRVNCKGCGKVKGEHLPWMGSPFYTRRFAFYVGKRCQSSSIREVADELNVDWRTAKSMEMDYMREKLQKVGKPKPNAVGIDEISVRKGHKYRIVVSDLERHQPIWFGGKDRTEESMDLFWEELGPQKLGTRPVSNEIVFTQGSFAQTGNTLDLVIQGNGFFQVKMPSGETSYTRDGGFALDKNGNIVNSGGNLLEPQITIPAQAQNISIANDGTVSYTQAGQTATQLAGQIQLANFQNPAGLNAVGGNLFMATDASGQPTVANPGGQEGLGTLLQGYQEQSNVSVVQEFINLIAAQRGYEANSKVVKAADEMYQAVNNITT